MLSLCNDPITHAKLDHIQAYKELLDRLVEGCLFAVIYSALVSTKVLCAAPSELDISRHPACAIRTPQGADRNRFSFRRKAVQSVFAGLRQIVKGCIICRVI